MFGNQKTATTKVEFLHGPADGLRLYIDANGLPDVVRVPHLQYGDGKKYLQANAEPGYSVYYWSGYRQGGMAPAEYYWCARRGDTVYFKFLRYV